MLLWQCTNMHQYDSGFKCWGVCLTSCILQAISSGLSGCFGVIMTVIYFLVIHFHNLLCDDFIWEIWVISETWLDYSKLTYHTCKSTNKGPKNASITFKGHKAVLLKAILAKTSNFWPIGPIELKFWNLILKMINFNISLRRSHGSSFGPLRWP